MGWLKAAADWNIDSMFATLAVFQLPMGWLKADANENICEQKQRLQSA